jgi:hypothetical protein
MPSSKSETFDTWGPGCPPDENGEYKEKSVVDWGVSEGATEPTSESVKQAA